MAFIMLSFRFEERDGVVRRQRTFLLMRNSMQTLKWLDRHANCLILRVTYNISFVCCVSSFITHCVLLEGAAQQYGERPPTSSLLSVTYWIHAQTFGVRGAAVLSWESKTEWEDSQVCIKVCIPRTGRKHNTKMRGWYTESFQRSAARCLGLFMTQQATKYCCTESKSDMKDLSLKWNSGQWGPLMLLSFWFDLTQLSELLFHRSHPVVVYLPVKSNISSSGPFQVF